jgi:hypothetical protein
MNSTALHLTRRGRAAVVMLVLSVLVLGGFLLGHVSSQASARPHHVTVEAGETLWTVASRVAPQADPRLEVARIQSLNHLGSPAVQVGQQLLVPAS